MDQSWKNTDDLTQKIAGEAATPPWETEKQVSKKESNYYPLTDTLRLYAGWLMAWYCLVFAVGSYQLLRPLPFHLQFIADLFNSSLIFPFSFAAFLFLLGTSLHRLWGRGILKGILIVIVSLGVFIWFLSNI